MNYFYAFKKKAVIFLLLGVVFISAEWLPFTRERMPTKTLFNVISSNEQSVEVNIKVFGADVAEYDANKLTDSGKEVFALLKIDEYAFTGEIGRPKLPMVSGVLDVPHKAEIRVEIISSEYTEIDLKSLGIDKRIVPVLPSIVKKPGEKEKFIMDEKTYTTDAYYPDVIADVFEGDGGLARGHRLATLRVYPVHYNPVTGKIRCYTNIRVKVDFIGGDILETQRVIAKDYSIIWEEFIKRMIINYPAYLKGVPPLPIYYDIFYNGQAQTVANKLGQWKKKKGYKVRMWNAQGWSAKAIDDTIRLQNPIATFLVVIGDPNSFSIPLPPSKIGSLFEPQTDLYYAEINGGNTYLPDMFYSRISILDTIEGNTAIEKVIDWEHANFGSAGYNWLKKACLIAGYDQNFQQVGIETNAYCRSLMLPCGYQVDTLIIAQNEDHPRIVNQINAGRIWCVYTAHGMENAWSISNSGDFTVEELINLTTNLDMYPMPCGHCCLTGDYDYSSNCFGETWDRLGGKGGICYYGSVSYTYWDEDDWLQRRYFDAIYTDSITGRLYETGRFTQWGLYWIYLHTNSPEKRYYFEVYHLFNDPSLDFWTDVPQNMVVSHDTIIVPGSQQFTVTVTAGGNPLKDALVCCWIKNQNPEMHVSAYTNSSGVATFNINPTTPGSTMFVTVTKHNFIPYEGYAIVKNSVGPYISLGKVIINDSNGDGQVNPGETVDYGVYAKNVGVATAQEVYGRLIESDPYVSVSIDSSWYGSIAQNDSVLGMPYYRFFIANNCPNCHSVNFTLNFRDVSNNTWISYPSVVVYAPILNYRSVAVVGGNGNGILDHGETVNLVVTIINEGGAVASNVTAQLTENSPYITVNDAQGSFGNINPGTTANNSGDPFTVTAASNTPNSTVVNFKIFITSGVYCDTFNFSLLVGKKHYYVWNPDPTPASGQNIHLILQNLGYSGDYGAILPSDLSVYKTLFVCVGVMPNNYVIESYSPEAQAIVNFLQNQNGRVYLEGGDVWYYDPQYGGYDFGPLFGINPLSDGENDMGPVQGITGTFTAGMLFNNYGGENNWMDHITASGTGAFSIFRDQDNSYYCGVARSSSSGYKTIGTSFELGLLADGSSVSTRAVLLDSIMHFFGYYTVNIEESSLSLKKDKLGMALAPSLFRNKLVISYAVKDAGQGFSLAIYDVTGRMVRDFSRSTVNGERSTILWDGTDDLGRKLPSGVYFVRFETDDFKQVEKAILLR